MAARWRRLTSAVQRIVSLAFMALILFAGVVAIASAVLGLYQVFGAESLAGSEPAGIAFTGQVRLAGTSAGLGGVTVTLLARVGSAGWAEVAGGTTGAGGYFSLSHDVAPGADYRVQEEDRPGYTSTEAGAPAEGSAVDPNTVQFSAPAGGVHGGIVFCDRRLEIGFSGHVYVHGTVEGIAGARVTLLRKPPGADAWAPVMATVTDREGAFSLSYPWDPGVDYRLTESDPPGYQSTGAITLPPGRAIGLSAVQFNRPAAGACAEIAFYDLVPPAPAAE